MQFREAIEKAEFIVSLTQREEDVAPHRGNFKQYIPLIAQIAREEITPSQRKTLRWLKEWAFTWRQFYDDCEKIYAADPMIMYKPMNVECERFHHSTAFIRYFRAGNRTGKTQSGYAEHYYLLTGQNPWRQIPSHTNHSFIISVGFKNYAPTVFERKMVTGETGNPISPMFPEGGKWLHHYDDRKHTLFIACPRCAEAGKPRSCHHTSTVKLFSDLVPRSWEQLQGAVYTMGHFDEHVDEEFFLEAWQRLQSVKQSYMVVTGTPLHGEEAWEHRRLTSVFLSPTEKNHTIAEDLNSPKLVDLFEIDQFSAGIVDHDKIKASMLSMDDFEIESRIYGRPAPLAEHPVFDRQILAAWRSKVVEPALGNLKLMNGKQLEDVLESNDLFFEENPLGNLRVWEPPQPNATYVAGIDTAAGLMHVNTKKKRDASCTSILKVWTEGDQLKTKLVAQWHGWKNPLEYAIDVFKVCAYYNSALAIVELTGGLGRAVVLRLKELGYWNIHRDLKDPEFADPGLDARYGIDTNIATKPAMISALQQMVAEDRLECLDNATIRELVAFGQETTESGLSMRFRGAGGSPDDRVMSLAIAVGVIVIHPLLSVESLQDDAISNTISSTPRPTVDGWELDEA